MATYTNLSQTNAEKSKGVDGTIFKELQTYINKKGFFGTEINTGADDRVLTGYENKEKNDLTNLRRTDLTNTNGTLNADFNTSIVERYKEFENMENTAEVAAALDLIADEVIQIGDNGHILKIQTKHKDIKDELESMFFQTLKIDDTSWDKVRGMCMYGNRFEEIVLNKKDPGVLYLNYIDPASIQRIEDKNRLVSFTKIQQESEEHGTTIYGQNNMATGGKITPFRIVHFRIEDARFIPYGRSLLEPARRTIRHLNMMEDAMLVYRYSRASEKRVWNIDCGELGPVDGMKYTELVRQSMRKKSNFNSQTGKLNYEVNPQCISLNTEIKLLDGRHLKLSEIIQEKKDGKELWTLSVDKNGGYHPGKIKWADVTRKNAEVVRVTLDDGSKHTTTPDHKFIMRDGSEVEAQDLKEGDSLMPLTDNPKALPRLVVVSVELLIDREDTGCIEVDNEYHNFPIVCSVDGHFSNYTFIRNSLSEDFFIPTFSGRTNNTVTQLAGASNLGEIDDVLYFKKKFFFALKIPLQFFSEDASLSKSNLALIDVRFARMVERIQRFYSKGLEKIAIIHLLLKKFPVEQIKEFKIVLTAASNIKKQSDLELLNTKLSSISNAKGTNLFPDIWILTTIYGLPIEEAENLLELMKMQQGGGDAKPGAGGGGGGGIGDILGGGDMGAPMGGEDVGGPEPEMPDGMDAGAGALDALTGDEGGEVPGGDAGADAGAAPAGATESVQNKIDKLLVENTVNETQYRYLSERAEKYEQLMETFEKIKNEKNILENKDNIEKLIREDNTYTLQAFTNEIGGILEYMKGTDILVEN